MIAHALLKNILIPPLLLAGMLLLCSPLGAQRFEAGATAGVNLSQLDGDKLAGFHLPGVSAGIQVDAILSERWRLGLEMLFSQQGSKRNLNDPASAAFDKIRLNFVEVPVLLKFREWKFLLNAGPVYQRLINFEAISVTGEDVSDAQSFNSDIFAIALGATFEFSDRWGMLVRWSKALTDLQADPGAGTLIGRNISLRAVYLLQ